MNFCFISGKIINDVNIKFILEGKHNSIVILKLKLLDDSVIEAVAYNEVADYCYRYLKKDDLILVEGRLNTKMKIIIKRVEKIKVLKNI